MSIIKAINIINWCIEKYENIKKWSVKKYRAYKTKKVRDLIDDHNIDAVDSIVRDLKKRRKDRHDAS